MQLRVAVRIKSAVIEHHDGVAVVLQRQLILSEFRRSWLGERQLALTLQTTTTKQMTIAG